MKVLMVEQNLPPNIVDGKRVHVYDLLNNLPDYGVKPYAVLERPGIHKSPQQRKENNEEFKAFRIVPVWKGIDWLTYIGFVGKYIRKLHKKIGFDLIHAHGPHAGFLYYYKPDIPVITTVHGNFYGEYRALLQDIHLTGNFNLKNVRSVFGARFYSFLEKKACKKSDGVISVSSKDKKETIKRYGVDPSKLKLIPHGINIEELRDPAEESNFELNYGRPIFLFVGRLAQRKGVKQLLKAWKLLKNNKMDGSLVLIGSGPLEGKVKKFCKESEEIFFYSNLPRKNLMKAYELADVFVAPSLFEGFPYVLLEAFTFSNPVIYSSRVGVENLLGDDVIYADPLDIKDLSSKINYLAKNKDKRDKLGKKAEELVKNKFTLEKMVKQTKDVYEDVLDS